ADAQEIRGVAGGRRPERFGQRHPERGAGSGPPAFFALLIIGHRFPLEGQEGRLFHPIRQEPDRGDRGLLAITLDPALRLTLAGMGRHDWGRQWWGRLIGSALRSEIDPLGRTASLSRLLIRNYQLVLLHALRQKGFVAAVVLIAAAITIPVYRRLGTEFI